MMYGSQNLPMTNNELLQCLTDLYHCHPVVRKLVTEALDACQMAYCIVRGPVVVMVGRGRVNSRVGTRPAPQLGGAGG